MERTISILDIARFLYIIGEPSIRTPEVQESFDHLKAVLDESQSGDTIRIE